MVRHALMLSVLTALATSASPSRAQGDEKESCLKAYDLAQSLRQEDKLVESREQLLVCVRNVCPALLRKDCTQWLSEVDQSMASVVIEARGPDGKDVVDVAVTVDGKPFVNQMDGKAVPINPGVHVFRFEMPGGKPIENRIVVHQAVKNRVISVAFESGSGPPPPPPPPGEKSGPPVLAYVLGGVGLVGIGGFTYFGLKFDSQLDDLDACSGHCPQEDVDAASTSRTVALISLGVGVVSLGVATYLFMTPSSSTELSAETPTAKSFDVVPLPGGGVGVLSGTF